MNAIFTNLHCNSFSYPVANHFLELIEKFGKPAIVYVHFWDIDVKNILSNQLSEKKSFLTREQQDAITSQIENFLASYNVKVQILFHHVSRDRLFRSEEVSAIFYQALTSISLQEINEEFVKEKYLGKRPSTFARIIYSVIDFLTFEYFEMLYPEFKTVPNVYYAGLRFKPVVEALKKRSVQERPGATHFFKQSIPIINYAENKWLDINSSGAEIERQVRKHFTKKPNQGEIEDILQVLNRMLKGSFTNPATGAERMNRGEAAAALKKASFEEAITFFSENFARYLDRARAKTEHSLSPKGSHLSYVRTSSELEKLLLLLNPKKFELLKACNGKNDIEKICSRIDLKRNSVQSYISTFKKNGYLTKEKKPKRSIEKIIIDFE